MTTQQLNQVNARTLRQDNNYIQRKNKIGQEKDSSTMQQYYMICVHVGYTTVHTLHVFKQNKKIDQNFWGGMPPAPLFEPTYVLCPFML